MVVKKKPAARSFFCAKCGKKRKMPFISEFWGSKTYECKYCGQKKSVG